MRYLILLFALCSLASAQEVHKFWDRQQKVVFASTLAVRAADLGQTCDHLAQRFTNGAHIYREEWIPSQRCGVVGAFILGGQAAQTAVQYALHRKGHHRLERIVPIVWTAPNVIGIAYSLSRKGPIIGSIVTQPRY